jgi:nucleoside-diphosphate-sugar epimerase
LKKRILITGGSGYVGSRLIQLFQKYKNKFHILNYDLNLFGNVNKGLKYVTNIKADIRNKKKFNIACNKVDAILHLACISNDPTFELNEKLSKDINFDCFENLIKTAKKNGVKKFIYASTCSVYGLSKAKHVRENHPLKPITYYNKYKALCEPVLNKYLDDNFQGVTIRPATVCGYSPKMRFDLTVNILTNYAFNKNTIKVFGGKQTRPNIHIDDICRLYIDLLVKDTKKINGEIFNAGFENLSILDIAKKVRSEMRRNTKKDVEIKIEKSADIRSYRVNSDKIKKILKFKPRYNVKKAINDLIINFKKGKIKNSFSNPNYFNIQKLKKINLK